VENLEETQELTPPSIIGWDPILCRPIFNEVVSSGSSLANDDSSLEDITSGSDQDHNKPILATTTKSMVQRTERSYGGRKRPYVILELLQDSSTFMSATKPKEIVDDDDNEPMLLPVPSTPLANISLPRQISILRVEDPATDGTCSSSSGEKPAARKKHRRLFPGKTKQERCASTATDSLAHIVVAESSVPENSNRPDNKKNATVLDFTDGEPPVAAAKEPELLHQPSSNTSLLEAQRFFERLDATHELKLDASDTPVATSKVIFRTSRRQISCSSPTVLQDYRVYMQYSNESGVTPLSLPNFLKSRSSIHKSELYDGFLDDEEE
jgi:hypothetical protein